MIYESYHIIIFILDFDYYIYSKSVIYIINLKKNKKKCLKNDGYSH